MEKKVLKGVTVSIVILTLGMGVGMNYLPGLHNWSVALREANAQTITPVATVQEISVIEEPMEESHAQLTIELPKTLAQSDISIENDYLTQTIYIRIPNGSNDYFSEYRIMGSSDHIANLDYYKKGSEGVIRIGLDKVYELSTHFEEGKLCMDFLSTHEVYDKVVVVDAGHGGVAVGAVKRGVEEKSIDLAIVLAIKEIFDEHKAENIGVYYTRLDDSDPSLKQRVELANKADADLFISIHNNSSSSGRMNNFSGTQVVYSTEDTRELGSERFANICLDQVCAATGSERVGLLSGDDIHIVRRSTAPVALIEVGFMTNYEELEKLQTKEYQNLVAEGVYKAVCQAFEEGF